MLMRYIDVMDSSDQSMAPPCLINIIEAEAEIRFRCRY